MPSLSRKCTTAHCSRKYYGKGYCAKHWHENLGHTRIKQVFHGLSKTQEYKSWREMKNRCLNPNRREYKHYGGRGVTIHQEWVDDFRTFYDYMGEAPDGYTLDRINVDGNYEPGNVRWASRKEQSQNKRIYKNNNTGYPNIQKKQNGSFYVRVRKNGTRLHVGTFESLDEAIRAYNDRLKIDN